MSGGELDYIHHRVQEAANSICEGARGRADQDRLISFSGFLLRVAEVLRSIEYDFSQDETLSAGTYDDMDRMVKAFQPGSGR